MIVFPVVQVRKETVAPVSPAALAGVATEPDPVVAPHADEGMSAAATSRRGMARILVSSSKGCR